MWWTGGGVKQSTRRGGPSLTDDLQTERERQGSVIYIYIFLHNAHKNSSYEEEEEATGIKPKNLGRARTLLISLSIPNQRKTNMNHNA